jgi:hypothetical protein
MAKYYERRVQTSETFIAIAAIRLLIRLLERDVPKRAAVYY